MMSGEDEVGMATLMGRFLPDGGNTYDKGQRG